MNRIGPTNKSTIFTLVFILLGCTSKEEFVPLYNVPEEFQGIVEKFIKEAELRGYSYDIDNLIITYDENIDKDLCGKCNSNSQGQNEQKIISINPDKCWVNDFQKETLIFHELGHCLLGRTHETALMPNGDPKSMMVKNDISIYSPCVYTFGNEEDCNFTYKRNYYLDELFDENTPIPDWAK